jgi:hypothetical protein
MKKWRSTRETFLPSLMVVPGAAKSNQHSTVYVASRFMYEWRLRPAGRLDLVLAFRVLIRSKSKWPSGHWSRVISEHSTRLQDGHKSFAFLHVLDSQAGLIFQSPDHLIDRVVAVAQARLS